MPKIDLASVPILSKINYPEPYKSVVRGRSMQAVGDAGGLTQFGVNLVRLKPSAGSSQRHWHQNEDEFLVMIEGSLTLVEDDSETELHPGDMASFKAGVPNAHYLVNRTGKDGVFLVVGTRAPAERAVYADIDLVYVRDEKGWRYELKSGEPCPLPYP
jgi:uncharacterized cupin superfamily protein